jgi:hypothetical protein
LHCVYTYIYIEWDWGELLGRYSVYGQIAEDKKQFFLSPEIDLSVYHRQRMLLLVNGVVTWSWRGKTTL